MTVLHVYWKGYVEWRVIDAFAHQLSLNQMEILKDSLRWRGVPVDQARAQRSSISKDHK